MTVDGDNSPPPEISTKSLDRQGRPLPRQLRIIVGSGPDRGRVLPLHPGSYAIGTDPGSDLALTDSAISRAHLTIEVGRSAVRIRDLGSKNGSYFAGARVEAIELTAAAEITIGATVLHLQGVDSYLAFPPSERGTFGDLLGNSESMRRLFAVLERIADSDASVLIEGETGTGKELVARALHQHSPRSGGALVTCDLAGLSTTVIESELFGHSRGAFTGADIDRVGAFESAHKGTLFLDEIGELSLEVQPRLLRALESHSIKRVGESSYRDVDTRVIAATNRDLAAEVEEGRFRADLYHRLAVVVVRIPALRDRRDDIPVLVERLIGALAQALRRPTPPITDDAMAILCAHDWPGNVRELRNVLERAATISRPGTPIDAQLLSVRASPAGPGPTSPIDVDVPFAEAKEALIATWERDYITSLLDQSQGNVSLASRRGGLHRGYLHRLMKKYGVVS